MPERPQISPEAQAAVPAFVELLREASGVQMPEDQLWARLNALGDENGLDAEQMGEAYVFASLAYAHELGGPEEVERMRRRVLAAGEAAAGATDGSPRSPVYSRERPLRTDGNPTSRRAWYSSF